MSLKKVLTRKGKSQQILTYRKPKFRQKRKTDETSKKKKSFSLTGKGGFRVILYIPNNTKNPKDKYAKYQ